MGIENSTASSGPSSERDLLQGLTRRQRHFILEKIVGMNDKDAALLAGYSLGIARNTKRKIWTPGVRAEFARLSEKFQMEVRLALLKQVKREAEERNLAAGRSAQPAPGK